MLTIRLRRMGRKDRAFYRFVVSDSRRAPTASAVEEVGHYDPLQKPPVLQIQRERIDYWVSNGATLSNTVKTLMRRAENGIMVEDKPKKAKAPEAPKAEAPEAPKAEASTAEAVADAKAEAETETEPAAKKATEAQEAKKEEAAPEAKAEAAADGAEAPEGKSEGETAEDSGSA